MKWDPRVSSACLLLVCALALGLQLCCEVREDLVECDCLMSCRCCCSEIFVCFFVSSSVILAKPVRPGDEVIAFLVDTDSELNFLMSKYCSGDDLSSAISVFQCLLSKAHLSAAGRIKRRVLVDPAWQRLSVARLVESVARSPQSARWCGCVICLELNCDGSALRRVVGVLMAWPLRGSPAPSESIRNFSIGAKN